MNNASAAAYIIPCTQLPETPSLKCSLRKWIMITPNFDIIAQDRYHYRSLLLCDGNIAELQVEGLGKNSLPKSDNGRHQMIGIFQNVICFNLSALVYKVISTSAINYTICSGKSLMFIQLLFDPMPLTKCTELFWYYQLSRKQFLMKLSTASKNFITMHQNPYEHGAVLWRPFRIFFYLSTTNSPCHLSQRYVYLYDWTKVLQGWSQACVQPMRDVVTK